MANLKNQLIKRYEDPDDIGKEDEQDDFNLMSVAQDKVQS